MDKAYLLNIENLTCEQCFWDFGQFCAKGYEFGIGALVCSQLNGDEGFRQDRGLRKAEAKAAPVVKDPTREEIIGLLSDWGHWVGNDRFEINKDAGYGKSIGQILVDRAKQDDPDTVYSKSRSSFYDQDAMNRIDYFVTYKESPLPKKQKTLLVLKYHKQISPRQKILKKLRKNKGWYYENHDDAIEKIRKGLNNILVA